MKKDDFKEGDYYELLGTTSFPRGYYCKLIAPSGDDGRLFWKVVVVGRLNGAPVHYGRIGAFLWVESYRLVRKLHELEVLALEGTK